MTDWLAPQPPRFQPWPRERDEGRTSFESFADDIRDLVARMQACSNRYGANAPACLDDAIADLEDIEGKLRRGDEIYRGGR